MRKFIYFFLAFIALYVTILSGILFAAILFYKENGDFILTSEEFLSPIKPAIYGLIIQIFVAKLLPSKNKGGKNDIKKR